MSIECGECERDLRGGHDIGCSRYSLRHGVAQKMLENALGREIDDDEGVPEAYLKAADAAIAHVRAYDAARLSATVSS